MTDLESLLRWYISLTVVAVALQPLIAWLGVALERARFGLLRPLSPVLLAAVVWWPAAVAGLPFSRLTLIVALIILAAAGWFIWWRKRFEGFNLRAILVFEALWLVMFLGYAWFRSYQPDIINTEKPMEIAFLTAISRSEVVPAPDPWFAGRAINYYYFGYQVFAGVIKLAGVPASTGFNLALASLFASTATAVAGAAWWLARTSTARRSVLVAAAGLSVVFVLLAGNLETPRRLVDEPRETVDAGWWAGVGWQASRIIVDRNVHELGDERVTINEFPSFSFVLGDLHPHVLTYPLLASVLALAIGLAHRDRHTPARLAAVGALVGLLYTSNSWDAPTGWLIVMGALVIGHGLDLRAWVGDLAFVSIGAVIAVTPFIVSFDAPVGIPANGVPGWISDLPIIGTLFNTFGLVTWRPSGWGELLIVHGVWVIVFLLYAIAELRQHPDCYVPDSKRLRTRLAATGLVLLLVAIVWMPAAVIIGLPLAVALVGVTRSPHQGVRILSGVFALGFLLVLVAELVFIQDVFGDRMNTVFKLYFQAWLLLAVASAAAFVVVLDRVAFSARYVAPLAVLIVLPTLAYAPLSAWDWTSGFQRRYGLDGSDYVARNAPGDADAIAWIEDHAQEGDVLVETPGCSYMVIDGVPMSRISAFSGVPTVIGWVGHEGQWRRGQDPDVWAMLERRAERARAVLDGRIQAWDSGARFVVLGRQEIVAASTCTVAGQRSANPVESLTNAGWRVVFESNQTKIFAQLDDPSLAELR